MNKDKIKDLLTQTFVSEAKVPGLDIVNKVKKENDKINKKDLKDSESKLSAYDKETRKAGKEPLKPVKFNYNNKEEEYHQEMEIMNGQEMIQYDRTPNDKFKKRAEDAIAGAAYMGNNPEWANVVPKQQGFTGPDFGKNLVKAIKSSEKKRSKQTPTSKMFGNDWEVVEDQGHKAYAFESVQNNKENINKTKMKRLTFKKPFNGVDNALKLIPESYKVDNKTFEITDGNESYKVRWEGSLNEGKGVVLMASNKTMVNEDMQKMFHLMGYKSEQTLGNLKGSERLNEDKKFSDIWSKTKTMLTESEEDMMSEEENETERVNVADIRKSDIDIQKNDVNKMSPDEKVRYNKIKNDLANVFALPGNQDTSQIKMLLDKLEKAISDTIAKKQPQTTTQSAPLGETDDMHEEEDRFDEIFKGLDEE